MARVVIVGGGFGGLAAAKALRNAPAGIILIDRTNHHLFQPLLYQVATSVLSPGQIAAPLRGILSKQKNTTVLLGDVTGVDADQKRILVRDADREGIPIAYDYLVLAVGTTFSYFGHDSFGPFAPGLKTAADALGVRNRILQAFELAEAEEDPRGHPELITFVLVGAGPTGVEMAGAIAEMVRTTLKSDFRRIDPSSTRVVLVDMAPRVLPTFAEDLSSAVHKRLEKMGVEVRLGFGVDQVDAEGVVGAGQRIRSRTVIWTAGVTPSPVGAWLKAPTDRAGRVRVEKDLTVPGHPEIYIVGDIAGVEQDGKPLPGVAQVALQEGQYAGIAIRRRISGESSASPFRYRDKGNMAVVGKGFAILETSRIHQSGFLVWVVWALVHIRNLALANLRTSVFLQWVWSYVTDQRGVRLIVER